MTKSRLEHAVHDTSQRASAHTLHWTRKLLLKRTIRWLAAVLLAATLLIFEFEGVHTPPKTARDWWGTILEVAMLLYATYKAQLYNESALVTGLAIDQKLQDEPYVETLIKAANESNEHQATAEAD